MSQVQSQVGAESILIADCGSARTKVVLLDIVSGQYRFVAFAESASTVNEPWDDVSLGVVSAIRQIEQTTGYLLLDDEGKLVTPISESGRGVDRFAHGLDESTLHGDRVAEEGDFHVGLQRCLWAAEALQAGGVLGGVAGDCCHEEEC